MAALEQRGMPVPKAIDHNRHAVLMSLVDAIPLTQATSFSYTYGPSSGCFLVAFNLHCPVDCV